MQPYIAIQGFKGDIWCV